MKALRSILLIVMLLSLLIVAGCNEGHASHGYSANNFTLEQSQTGFWQPKYVQSHSSNMEYEISRK